MKDVRLKSITLLDVYVPDGKSSHLSQLNLTFAGMLLFMGNLLVLIRLENLMERYGTPFYGINWLSVELCAMEATSLTLIPERTTIMPVTIPQVSASEGTCSQEPSQTIIPSFGALAGLTPLVVRSIQLPRLSTLQWS